MGTIASAEYKDNKLSIEGSITPAMSLVNEDICYEIVLTEDGVAGTMSNSYAQFKVPFEGYENKPYELNVTYDDVFRDGYSSTDDMTLPKTLKAGEEHKISFTHTYALGIVTELGIRNKDNVKATLLIIRKTTGEILNAARIPVSITGEASSGEASISCVSTGHGSVQASAGKVSYGGTVTFTFSPDNGYKVDRVILNGEDVTRQVSGNRLVIRNVSCDLNLQVSFTEEDDYEVTLIVEEGGKASVSKNTLRYGDSVELTIEPDEGYELSILRLNGSNVTSQVVDNKFMVTNVTSDITFKVSFRKLSYSVQIEAIDGGGKVKASSSTVSHGESVTLTITPDNGYAIQQLLVNDEDVTSKITDNQYVVADVKENLTVKAVFAVQTYKLTYTASEGGSVKPSTPEVSYGGFASYTIVVDKGYRLKTAVLNNKDITDRISVRKKDDFLGTMSEGYYSIINISTNQHLDVVFERAYCLVGYTAGAGGSVTASADKVMVGEGVTFTIVPNDGYAVSKATLNGVDVTGDLVENTYRIETLDTDVEFNVEFSVFDDIKDISDNSLNISYQSGMLKLSNLEIGESLYIFTETGKLLHSIKADTNDVAVEVPANNVFIIKTKNMSAKFIAH